MVQHIIDFAEDFKKAWDSQSTKSGLNWVQLLKLLDKELKGLDSNEIPPNLRGTFAAARQKVSIRAGETTQQWSQNDHKKLADEIIECLKVYGFTGAVSRRQFPFIYDNDLKAIIERDYHEFDTKLIPDKAWKSAVIMAGSILEAILYDVFLNPIYNSMATESSKAPRDDAGRVKNLASGKWTLEELIIVAEHIRILPADQIKTIDQSLRDFRNFVHPKKEIRGKYPCDQPETLLAKGALDRVCNLFEKTIRV